MKTVREVIAEEVSFQWHVEPNELADTILSALKEAGYVVVPVKPTDAMLQGACNTHTPGKPMSDINMDECPGFVKRRTIWASMLTASQDQGRR